MDDFDYKKYSLEKLETWMRDALTAAEATPNEIYDIIRGVVEEEYHYFKYQTGRCNDLLALINGNRIIQEVTATGELWDKEDAILSCDKDDPSPECKKNWVDFWEETYYPEEHKKSKEPSVEDIMPPWGHSNLEALRYTEEELNAMCERAASEAEKQKCREYNLREAEYYDKRAKLDAEVEAIKKAGGYEWTPPTSSEYTHAKIQAASPYNDGFTQEYYQNIVDKYEGKKDKVVKWQLPVEVDGASGEYFINFPDDLLEAANLKEGDQVEWIKQGNGSYLLKKV